MGVLDYISRQFMHPKGWAGRLIGKIQNYSNRTMYGRLVALLHLDATDKILDIGYGNGYLLELIYKKQPVDMYGIDISADAKATATKRNEAAHLAHQLHLEVGDCCSLPYADGLFSAITTINTVYFWSNTLQGLKEIRRTLADGGVFYNVFYTKTYLDKVPFAKSDYRKFEVGELVQLGEEAGFTRSEPIEIKKGECYIIRHSK